MSQPPYGTPPYGSDPPGGSPTGYPQQQLLPQQVAAGRSRRPLVIAALAVVVVLAGVLLTLRVVHDNGERNRAAYCTALRTVTHGGDLAEAFSGFTGGSTAQIDHLRDLAPSSVKSQWDDVVDLLGQSAMSRPDMTLAARLVTDLTAIINDADSSCGLKITLMP